jgi:hypothetical protein
MTEANRSGRHEANIGSFPDDSDICENRPSAPALDRDASFVEACHRRAWPLKPFRRRWEMKRDFEKLCQQLDTNAWGAVLAGIAWIDSPCRVAASEHLGDRPFRRMSAGPSGSKAAGRLHFLLGGRSARERIAST